MCVTIPFVRSFALATPDDTTTPRTKGKGKGKGEGKGTNHVNARVRVFFPDESLNDYFNGTVRGWQRNILS